MVKCAEEWGVSHSVFLTLLLAKELVGANVPQEILIALSPPDFDPKFKEWAINQIFSESTKIAQDLSPHFWEIFQPSSVLEKVKTFKKVLIPSSEFISQKYDTVSGTTKNRLYYFVRFKDHIFRYTKALLKILFRDRAMREHMEKIRRDYEVREWLGS